MEVQKRVQLKTLDKPKEADANPVRLAVRFEIKLEESTDDRCPEISYTDLLLKHEMKRKRASMSSNSRMSDADPAPPGNEDNLEALAKQMEEKYGKAYGGLSRGRHVDLGDGYDTEDSFIDNEEAYDELVPSSLTTQHGGFYINTGVLDFKEVSDDEIVSDSEFRPKKKKKIVSSSGSERENKPAKENVKKRRKKALSVGTAEAGGKKGLLTKKRKKILATDKLDKERIKKKKILLQKKKRLVERPQIHLTEKELDVKAKQYDSLIDDVINNQANLGSLPQDDGGTSETVSTSADAIKGKDQKAEPVKLPENLSEKCLQIIDALKQAASKCVDEKSRFFTNDINNQLTSLDIEVRKIGSSLTRNAVYSHLSSFLPINRETLMKRMKLLRLKELSGKLRQPLDDLKAAINEEMTGQIERFKQESQARLSSKLEDVERQKEDTQDSEDEWQSVFSNQTSTSGTQSLPTSTTTTDAAAPSDEKKKERASHTCRKKFEWTEKVRDKLCAVITIKMESYDFLKAKGQTPEIYLKEFLEHEVRTLWPKGWMQSRVLYRESKVAHVKWTNPSAQHIPVKSAPKKPALITNAMKMAANISTKKTSQPTKGTTVNKGVDGLSKSTALPTSTTGAEAKELKPPTTPPVASTSAKSLNKCPNAVSKSSSGAEASPTSTHPVSLAKASTSTDINKPQKPTSTTTDKKEIKTVFDSPSSSMESKGFTAMTTASVSSASGFGKSIGTLATFKQVTSSFATSSKGDNSTVTASLSNCSTFTKVTSVLTSSGKAASSLNLPLKVTVASPSSVKGLSTLTNPVKITSSLAAAGRMSITSASPVKVVSAPATSSRATSGQVTKKLYTLTEGIPTVTLSDSPSPTKTWAVPVNSTAISLGKLTNRQHNIVKVSSGQAATVLAAQNARILQEKHLAASLASQKNMIKHKKMAETLANTQTIAKQQQMAAIQAEQKAAANRATQQHISQLALAQKRMLVQKQLQEQQKLAQIQQTRLQAQQKIIQGQQTTLVHVSPSQQQKLDQTQSNKLAQAQQHKLVSSAQQLEMAKHTLAQAQQKLSSSSAQDISKQTHTQQAQYLRMQLQQQQRSQWQSLQQMANQPGSQPSGQQKTIQYNTLGSSPSSATALRGSSVQAATPTLATTSTPHVPGYNFAAASSSSPTPVSPSSGNSPSWPISPMQQQAQMAEYRRYLSKMDEK
ncbi:ubinuclein-2-like isoform X2 [Watersipora subatra]|uniref:ubinuclein-2-like isoform X2 n=1 Tax=Watersipora subatra TaxID=2589382 RepID=UPI00355BA43F